MTITGTPPKAASSGNGTAPLDIDVDIAAACLTMAGELDLSTVDELRTAAAMLVAGTARNVTIDLDRLQFIDAVGLGEMVRIRAELKATGRDLVLCRPCGTVRRTFTAGGLGDLLAGGRPGQ